MNYKITGGNKLKGDVYLQGSKNSAMKHVFTTLLAPGKYTFKNMPDISSIHNLLKIHEIQGGKFKWLDRHTVEIDSTGVRSSHLIPSDLFYHTSGAMYLNSVMTNRFGSFNFEVNDKDDAGGDQIGRIRGNLEKETGFFDQVGISVELKDKIATYTLVDSNPFKVDLKGSLGLTIGAIWLAVLRDGTSTLLNPGFTSFTLDQIQILRKMGAKIDVEEGKFIIHGGKSLKPVDYENMFDKHDFITFLVAALITESELTIHNVQYDLMKLSCLDDVVNQMSINLEYDKENEICHVKKNKIADLKPIKVIAKEYPFFVTEWQVLFSPLLALIPGQSEVIEGYHFDRMKHWLELSKMGAKYEFFQSADYPERDGNPRAVRTSHIEELKGTTIDSKDVRGGAAMVLAGLGASGETTVMDPKNHILRGYEDLIERLVALGAMIDSIND